jgi:predicted nucleic acid-binding protein
LLVGERRKRLTEELTHEFLLDLDQLPFFSDQANGERVFGDVQRLCRKHRLTAYDAAYLELAIREGCALATVDDDLKRAAIAEEVPIA